MIILEANQKCPHSGGCKYNQSDSCHGARPNRPGKFTCEYADQSGVFESGQVRSPLDSTGKMQVLTEGT